MTEKLSVSFFHPPNVQMGDIPIAQRRDWYHGLVSVRTRHVPSRNNVPLSRFVCSASCITNLLNTAHLTKEPTDIGFDDTTIDVRKKSHCSAAPYSHTVSDT